LQLVCNPLKELLLTSCTPGRVRRPTPFKAMVANQHGPATCQGGRFIRNKLIAHVMQGRTHGAAGRVGVAGVQFTLDTFHPLF